MREKLAEMIKRARKRLWQKGTQTFEAENAFIADHIIASGQVFVIPCDVGDPVWILCDGEIWEKKVISVAMLATKYTNHMSVHCENKRGAVTTYETADFGKTIFLTCEDAETALKVQHNKKEK